MDLSTTNEAGAVYDTYLTNFMNEDGSVNIPTVLQPYMGGKTKLTPKH